MSQIMKNSSVNDSDGAKINLFINKYDWEGINFPSKKMTKK